jgi:hypothetical protein
MLIYDQSLDPYHGAVRALGIFKLAGETRIEYEALGIVDLVITFPSMLDDIRLPKEMLGLRKRRIASANPFRPAPKGRAAIESVRAVQFVALATLASGQLIDSTELETGMFVRTANAMPAALTDAVDSWLGRDSEDKHALVTMLLTIPLRGEDGLKHRTKLLEHRYDPI